MRSSLALSPDFFLFHLPRPTLFALAGASLLLFLLSITFFFIFVLPKLKHATFPGPRPSLLLGNIPDFARAGPGKVHLVLLRYARRHGKVFQFWQANRRTVVVADPEDVRFIITTKQFPKHEIFNESLSPIGGNGLLTANPPDKHTAQRRAIAKRFNEDFLKHLHAHMRAAVGIFLRKMDDAAAAGTTIDFDKEITDLTLDVIIRTAFGVETNIQTDANHPLPRAIATTLAEIFKNMGAYPVRQIFVSQERLKKAVNLIAKFCQGIIDQRRAETPEQKAARVVDLLDIFLEIDGANDKYVISEISTFLIAGHDTTSHTLSFLVYEVCQNPAILARIQAEVDAVMRTSPEGSVMPPFEKVAELDYLRCVWNEALRKHPVAATGTMRVAPASVTLPSSNLPIEKGSAIIIPPYLMHRDPDLWPEPEIFNPDRFARGVKPKHPFAFQGFSSGPRNCIGQFFATHEALTILVVLYYRYKITLGCDPKLVQEHHATTMKPRVVRPDGTRTGLPVHMALRRESKA